MTDVQWGRVLELYETVCDLTELEARRFLHSSGEEPAIVAEVALMLIGLEPESLDVPEFAGCVIGRYDVSTIIGRGSTGEVYSGRDRELSRKVALKFMTAESASEASAVKRFRREAQAASALNHPNIVTIHEVIVWKGSPVIVTELVDGTPLRTLCGKQAPVEDAIRIGGQIMQALAFAHGGGIVHRDLKPENVMVRPDGYVKVLDFGLARPIVAETGAGEFSSTAGLPVGTLRYMSPEQCRGERATPASDVFAAGIILYELMAGQHPFHADSPLDTAHAIVWDTPRPLQHVNPDVPPIIHSLVMGMLLKDAGARPSSVQAAEVLSTTVAAKPPQRPAYHDYARFALILILLVFGAFLFTRGFGKTKAVADPKRSELQIVPLANLRGNERKPSFSPDGMRVAFDFSGENAAVSHIYVQDLSDSRLTRLTNDELPDFEPAFSPDGARLAFLRETSHRTLRVMVMPSAGGAERQVQEVNHSSVALGLIAWDGRGANLIVSGGLDKPTVQVALFAISIGTGAIRQITFPRPGELDSMPAVSPDGRTLGFLRSDAGAHGDLWTMPLPGGSPAPGVNRLRRLTDTNEHVFCWNWTADGRDLLISFSRAGRTNLWRRPVNGGPLVRVAGMDEQVKELAVAPKGNRLVYAPGNKRSSSIWKYSVHAGDDLPKPIISSAAYDADERYSPDGKYIAFDSLRSGQGQTDIWVASSDGSNPRKMTSFEDRGEHAAGSPSWSPDGRWIAFDASFPQILSSIFVLDALGGKPRRLTGPGALDSTPNWSRDGHFIYFSSDKGGLRNIWKVPASGGDAVPVTRNGGFECFESADGRFLYYTKSSPQVGFWRMPLAGGEETRVPGLEAVAHRSWDNSPQGIYFVSASKPPILQLFHFATGRVTRVRELPVEPEMNYRGLSVAPDGRSLLYMQGELTTSNLMVVNNFP